MICRILNIKEHYLLLIVTISTNMFLSANISLLPLQNSLNPLSSYQQEPSLALQKVLNTPMSRIKLAAARLVAVRLARQRGLPIPDPATHKPLLGQ